MSDEIAWYCGAFEPVPHGHGSRGLRCTEPAGHPGDHMAAVDGRVLARWLPVGDVPPAPKEAGE